MNSLEALNKLYFDNKDLHIDITLNDRKICEIYNIIKQDLDRLEKLEKELRQTKLNFKNSQIHSKNCYKKLKAENQKLKKVIEQIKALPNCDICDENWHKGCMCLKKKIMEVLENDK